MERRDNVKPDEKQVLIVFSGRKLKINSKMHKWLPIKTSKDVGQFRLDKTQRLNQELNFIGASRRANQRPRPVYTNKGRN